jgi:glycerophosphoryl diester phosphodiesterase
MTEIWGHRGAYAFAPENTLKSFQIAAEMGANGVEMDIQLTKDGEIVVIHDEAIDRTSNGHGYVKDLSLSELKKINFNKRGITPPMFMEIPTLAEVFELLKPINIKINIEFKTNVFFYECIEKKALALAEKFGMTERIVWSSFNHFSVQHVKKIEPSAKTALLCYGLIFVTGEQCEKIGAEALHPHFSQLQYPCLIDDCKKRGIKIRPWTVNNPDELKNIFSLGVDAVFTNRIDIAKEWITHELS